MSRSLLQLVLRHAEAFASGPDAEADCELLSRFTQTRDERAFEELLRRHGPMVWAVCRQSLPDHADAEDAFQATFLALIRSANSVRGRGKIAGWLHGVAVRVAQKVKRSAVRRRQREERAANGEADRPVPDTKWDALLAAVHAEVQRLPDAMRTAFVLCELEGVRQPDAAAQLGCKPGTLTSRLTRARQLLIERLSSRGLAPAVAGGSLGLGAATATAAVPQNLIDTALSLLSAGEAVSPAILALVHEVTPMMIRTKLVAATLLVACGFGAALYPDSTPQPRPGGSPAFFPTASAVAPDTAPALPDELRYVPADAAFFLHVDAAKLWNGSLGKSLRAADAKTFEELAALTKKLFGATPDALKTATLFIPKMERDPTVGIVLVFNGPYDKAKLLAGLKEQLPKEVACSVETPSDRMAVLLVDLDAKIYGKPQPAEKTGPLTAAIRDAGIGKHLLVAGSTLANLPDEIRAANLPPAGQAFKPLLQAEAISAVVDLDKELSFGIRVKAATPKQAEEAEKALGALSEFVQTFLGKGIEEIAKDPGQKDVTTIMIALNASMKEAKYSTEGDVARMTAKVSADLPFAMAYLKSKQKVTAAAARSTSSNNLKQIALAMYNYHDVHGALPPAAVCDKTGKPLLSWRVLILPYIEHEALYKEFKLDEPWDSDHNKKLIAKMPRVYLMLAMMGKANETHYCVFVGNGAAFDTIKGSKLTDFADGTSNTILVATAKDSVPWTKPDDLAFDPDKDMTKLLGFFPGEVCPVAMGDGFIRALAKSISKKNLHGAITTSGGEVLEDEE